MRGKVQNLIFFLLVNSDQSSEVSNDLHAFWIEGNVNRITCVATDILSAVGGGFCNPGPLDKVNTDEQDE